MTPTGRPPVVLDHQHFFVDDDDEARGRLDALHLPEGKGAVWNPSNDSIIHTSTFAQAQELARLYVQAARDRKGSL